MLAVPLHGDDVAPRFCSADQFLLADPENGQLRTQRLTLAEQEWFQRLERLSAAGVRVLLCGGFNRHFLPVAEGLGIRVISGLAGRADRLIDAFLRNELERYRFLPCRERRRRRGGSRWSEQIRAGASLKPRPRKGRKSCRDTTDLDRQDKDRAPDGGSGDAAGRAAEPEP